jgi:hypothetical protein
MKYRPSLAMQAVFCMALLTACSQGFKQGYTDDGMPIFDAQSFANLHPEGAFYPEQRATEKTNGCTVTVVSTDTPKHAFTTRYEVCDEKSRDHALVHMRDKASGTVTEVHDLTADREAYFEHSLRFADIDGDGTAEMAALSCSGAAKVDDCKRVWLYRLSKEGRFINFFAADYQKLWINEHYIVTASDAQNHRTYHVYLRNPRQEFTGHADLDKYNENTVTWSHGLLFFTEMDAATGACKIQFKSQSTGEVHPMHPIPESLRRFCSATTDLAFAAINH